MDPVSLALIALKMVAAHPAAAASAVDEASRPAAVDISKMKSSIADLSIGILSCYHKTAHFEANDFVNSPWERQAQYAADISAVIRITYSGISHALYQMDVAVMAKGSQVRTHVLSDTAVIPYSKKCALENWTGS